MSGKILYDDGEFKIIDCQDSGFVRVLNPPTDKRLDEIYFSRRQIENFSYLVFTNTLINFYESDNILSKKIIKGGYFVLNNFSYLKKIFINQAMGIKSLI